MAGVNLLGAICRRPDLTFSRFAEHWLKLHRALMMPLAAEGYLIGYVQNLRLTPPLDGLEADLDGAPELRIRDRTAFAQMALSSTFRGALEVDTPRFVRMPPAASLVSRTTVLGRNHSCADTGSVKLMIFVHSHEQNARSCLARAWRESRTPILMPSSRPAGLVRMTAQAEPGVVPPYFGCESSWWPDRNHLEEAWNNRLSLRTTRDLGIASTWVLPAEEHFALEPRADR